MLTYIMKEIGFTTCIGKSSLMMTFYKHESPRHLGGDSAFRDYTIDMIVDGKPIPMHIWHIKSWHKFTSVYANADVVLVCFSLVSYRTLLSVPQFWCIWSILWQNTNYSCCSEKIYSKQWSNKFRPCRWRWDFEHGEGWTYDVTDACCGIRWKFSLE